MAEFQRRGIAIKSLGNKLACYFGDGVAFQVPTGLATDAYRPQTISRSRGLLGTKALAVISPNLHFGIFNDGWWFLDSSGRWSEAGTFKQEESPGKSFTMHKWKEAFYSDLDYDIAHRIVTVYDRFRQLIRIAYPSKSRTDNQRILNYHWPTDTCWRDEYASPVTAWGLYDQQIRAGLTWAAATDTWASIAGTWGSYAAQFINELVVHGDNAGLVFVKDSELINYDGVAPTLNWSSHSIKRGEDTMKDQTFSRFGVEYMAVAGGNVGTVISTNGGAQFQSLILPTTGNVTSMQSSYARFRLKGLEHVVFFGVTGQAMIRSFLTEIQTHDVDDRNGQS
jgi:hypothetical protein